MSNQFEDNVDDIEERKSISPLQRASNFAQGLANALIIDHVSVYERGRAAGALNLVIIVIATRLTVLPEGHTESAPTTSAASD